MDENKLDEKKIDLARKARFTRRNAKRSKIRKDLEIQIGENQINFHIRELLEDYLFMWDTMQELKFDIKERGVNIFWKNGPTQYGYKKNDSVSEMTKVSKQMLSILKDLGLQPSKEEADDDEFEL